MNKRLNKISSINNESLFVHFEHLYGKKARGDKKIQKRDCHPPPLQLRYYIRTKLETRIKRATPCDK